MGRLETVRVLLGDELAMVRAGTRGLLAKITEPQVQVVADTGDGQALIELVSQFRPDLVIVEHLLTGMDGQEVVQRIRHQHPEVRVLFLTARGEPNHVRNAMHAGAAGYVVKDAEPIELTLAVRALARGQRYLSPRVAANALDRRVRARDDREGVLSVRQREVLRMMARGKSTREIAALMGVSVKTVETHRARMATVLGLYGVNALMRFAIKAGMDNGEL